MPLESNKRAYAEAALLFAQGELTQEQIAERVGTTPKTLIAWKKEHEFRRLIDHHVAELLDRVKQYGIAQLHNRVKGLQDRHRRLERLIEERAGSQEMQGVPGGTTGLLVRHVKVLGKGNGAERVEQFEVDTGTLAELRAIEVQAAKELGQWKDKTEYTGRHHMTVNNPPPFFRRRTEPVVDPLADLTPEEKTLCDKIAAEETERVLQESHTEPNTGV